MIFTIAKWKREEGKTIARVWDEYLTAQKAIDKATRHDQRIFCIINDFIHTYRFIVIKFYTIMELIMRFHNMLRGRV